MGYFLIRSTGAIRLSAVTESDARTAAGNLMHCYGGEGRLVSRESGPLAACTLVESYGSDGETLLVSSGVRCA